MISFRLLNRWLILIFLWIRDLRHGSIFSNCLHKILADLGVDSTYAALTNLPNAIFNAENTKECQFTVTSQEVFRFTLSLHFIFLYICHIGDNMILSEGGWALKYQIHPFLWFAFAIIVFLFYMSMLIGCLVQIFCKFWCFFLKIEHVFAKFLFSWYVAWLVWVSSKSFMVWFWWKLHDLVHFPREILSLIWANFSFLLFCFFLSVPNYLIHSRTCNVILFETTFDDMML